MDLYSYYRFFGILTIISIFLCTTNIFIKGIVKLTASADGHSVKRGAISPGIVIHGLIGVIALVSGIIHSTTEIYIYGGNSPITKMALTALIVSFVAGLFAMLLRKNRIMGIIHAFFGIMTALLLLAHGFEPTLLYILQ